MVTTTSWDASEHLDSKEAIAAYLDAVLEEGDAELARVALADIDRAYVCQRSERREK